MNNNTTINDGLNAVSVYGQTDGMDDFPVLKAFQQYIDAEQAKARKRMVMLCIFFGVLIGAVIAVFMVMLHAVGERNQALNDRLVEYVMKERDRQATAAQQVATTPSASETTLKAMTDSLVAIQKELAEKKAAVDSTPSAAEVARQQKLQSEQDALTEQRALLESERKILAAEREKLRQQEIEIQRRKLYPEYYQEKEARAAKPQKPTTSAKKTPTLSQADIDEILAEVDGIYEDETNAEKSVSKPSVKTAPKKSSAKAAPTAPKKPAPKVEPATVDDDDDAIEYFNDDEYSLPVDIKGTSAGWKVLLK